MRMRLLNGELYITPDGEEVELVMRKHYAQQFEVPEENVTVNFFWGDADVSVTIVKPDPRISEVAPKEKA